MSTPIILLPGMGADARMFQAQRSAFPQILVPAWPTLISGEPLRDFAARLASALPITPETVLGGASMGGMVALEIAKLVPPRAVVLLGSCRDAHAVPFALRLAERLTRPLPTAILERCRVFDRLSLGRLGPLTPDQKSLILTMARGFPMSFIRWAGRAILEWPGVPELSRPILHLHGRLDRMLLPGRVHPDIMLEDAGHLPSMTHPGAVNSMLARACTLPV